MSSKKRKVKVKAPSEKVYEFLTFEEIKAKEQKFTNHINELRFCLNLIHDASLVVTQIEEQQLIADKWHDFITCFPLPKPYRPADIRLYMEKLKYFEDVTAQQTIDWTLSVDERSLLTQNIFRKDLTRKTLKNTIKPNFGNNYNEDIGNCINVIRRIEYFLDNDAAVAKCSNNILEDIKKLKSTIQNEINLFFDRYTYRILCSENTYMTSVDAISTEYCFSTYNFQIHIWSLKNVPVRFTQLEEPRLIANFHGIKVTLHIPSFMLQQNLSIRAIHLNFDHISEYAKSFSQKITFPKENVNANTEELPDCLLNEWLMQLDIQNRVRNAMIQKRLEYEEKLRLLEEEAAKKKGNKSKEVQKEKTKRNKKSKVIKPSKEPPIIGPDVYPDTWTDFLVEEQQQYETFINTVYNPEYLGLQSDEINLKKYFILGGIYQLSYVRKAKHNDFSSFNMTWHQDDTNLVINNNIHIPYSANLLERRYTKVFKRLTARDLSVKNEVEKESTDPECPWFVLTIVLPEYLCYWGEPIACHYETIETKTTDDQNVESFSGESVKNKSKTDQHQALVTEVTPESEIKKESPSISDPEYFPFLVPQNFSRSSSVLNIKHHSTSPLQSNCFRSAPSHISSRQAEMIETSARDADGVLNVKDFKLNVLLSKFQIRHMEKHLIPRLISSFKFPKELQEDELEAILNRPKSKGDNLLRKQANIECDQNDKIKRLFTYNQRQNNPERIFTIYPREEPMRVIQCLNHLNEEFHEPQSFYHLVNIINYIKRSYKRSFRKTFDLHPFKSGVKLENRHLREQHKVKRKASTSSKGMVLDKSHSNMRERSSLDFGNHTKDEDAKVDVVEPSEANATETLFREASSETQLQLLEEEPKGEILGQEENTKIQTYSHWTTQHILKSEYDKTKCTIILQTDRLGYIGFAFKRYEHFPFKYWKLEPSETDPENEVVFTLETPYVVCVLYITGNGIRGHVTEPTTTFKRNPKMYLIINEPMKDYKEFKKMFQEKYLNIFADHDGSYYIENGYFSEKHLATEMHTYNCMAVNCTQMKFNFSQWNRLAKRRDIILQFVQYKDLPENSVEVRITPEEAFFVEITEMCSDNVDDITLKYNLTWRNINTYSDLHHLIYSMYPAAIDLRCKNAKLINCVRNLLNEIRPLSFS